MKRDYFNAGEIETSSRMKRYGELLKIYYICLCVFIILAIVIFALFGNKTEILAKGQSVGKYSYSELLYICTGTVTILVIAYSMLSIIIANVYIFKLEKFRNKNKNKENYDTLIKDYIISLNKLSKCVNILTLNKNMSDYIVEYFYS
ncbi:hypothetical protein NPA07_03985 [Mycoplasmopsis caviae]|uniref:Uncharacterized protein n=1 Tax=Mycoplasmopsis caviae TaxID=55603 RepID=A0A3P8MES5_9BACT|nr:hypothetical protein [Mycoplasmopsis caviae]UUD34945.1 hypothetical protein NPA07_03985 [Mycoplasmopsis caviae]VDR42226.1 Uncharacterised protein [Mycoplasmopsis caviae]